MLSILNLVQAVFPFLDFEILPYCRPIMPAKQIASFEAVFRVFAIVKMALDNLLKGEICKQMTGS